jgi:membrane protein
MLQSSPGRVVASQTRRALAALGTEAWLVVRAIARGTRRFAVGSDLTFASSIAYYSLLSLFPFLLLAVSIVGAVSSTGGERDKILQLVFQLFPRHFEFIRTQLEALGASSLRLGLTGSIVLIWAAMGVFGAITSAVNHAWGVERHPSYFKHKLVSFLMLVAASVLLLAALVFSSAVSVVRASWFAEAVARIPVLDVVELLAVRWASLFLLVFVLGLLYFFVPNAQVRFRHVWVGAVLAGVLWQGALSVFSWYVGDLSRWRMVHGSLAAVVVFLIWVYTSAVILLLGVEVSAAYARLRADRSDTQPAAEPLG